MPELKSRKPKINFSFLFISTVIIFLLFLSTASFKAYAFNYIGTAGTPGMPDPSKDLVKIIAPNAVTDNIFIGQPITQLDWYGSGGRILLMNFDNSPETDIIVASPYGEYHFSNDYSGMILINKGPVTSNVPGASYGWDCGNW
ncbi:MAG TPA: hypothetical protein PKW98_15500, partial [Candidatus Wallbacteria bacterium]|nr:hypothetical protein [Candidatus Wallbacteria bacterium]